MDEVCVLHLSDIELAEKMRRTNYEKFKTLVRMHLSFHLDLNTDEFDLPCHEVIYYEKGKLKKWNRLSKKIKGCTSGKANSSPPEVNRSTLDENFIKQLRHLKMFIMMEENVVQEGIFRKTGSASRQNELRALIQSEKQLDLSNGYTVHDCATVFKSYLAELHEPVLTDAHYPAHSQIAPLCNSTPTPIVDKKKEQHLLNSMQLLLLHLPDENRTLLQDIIEMLHIVSSHETENKMSSENLATLFAPHLICPRNLPPEALHYVAQTMCAIITFMITKGLVVFEIPAKLSTDIRAYFVERKRKETMSPEQTLDDSISDMSTVNTVYTFVDREKTAAAHSSNNTDTELAQLYAHIQTLPESSKKRRLIKQFNKQNGQGTPLQLVTLNRIKHCEPSRSSKSISDSIKKHIFHKSIISRTPKRTTVTMNSQGTPNFSTKNPKLRVLFQSPISNVPFHSKSGTPSTSSPSSSSTNIFSIKSHPLKKSISSSSLLLTNSIQNSRQDHTSVSAPVSRTTSSELEENCCITPLKTLKIVRDNSSSYAISTPIPSVPSNVLEVKPIPWKSTPLTKVNETVNKNNPLTPINKQNNQIEYQSRYKSEPNLSRIIKEHKEIPIAKSKSLTRKLIKGVSMGNLRLPFSNDSSKRFGRSTYSLKRDVSDESGAFREENESDYEFEKPVEEDEEEEDDEDEEEEEEENDENNTLERTTSHLSYYRNLELITSTPSMMLERRSMSPITKSTQRMPKSMQESIMTPRSRKPVMLTTTQGSSEQNQTFYQSDLSSFREQDEDSVAGQVSCGPKEEFPNKSEQVGPDETTGALSSHFKDYLLSRSVLTASPADLSFFSQTDDLGTTQDMEDFEESQLSSSLLYCLDGNRPEELKDIDEGNMPSTSTTSISRKRPASSDIVDENKENNVSKREHILLNNKLFITEYDGNGQETSI